MTGCWLRSTNADDAVAFSHKLLRNTGHAVVRVRAGTHIGQVTIDDGDAFGRNVNLAARAMGFLKHDGVIVTNPVKVDLDSRRSDAMSLLRWKSHEGVELKGIADPQTLWELVSG